MTIPRFTAARLIFEQPSETRNGDPLLLMVEVIEADGLYCLAIQTRKWIIACPEDLLPILKRVNTVVSGSGPLADGS